MRTKTFITLFILTMFIVTSCNSKKHYNEWVKKGNTYYYYDNNGSKVKNCERKIGSALYYFEKDGKMVTGIKNFDDKTKYYGEDGKQKRGWIQIENDYYYFDERSGEMKKGWVEDKGQWYFLDDTGKMLKNEKRIIDGNEYIFNEQGIGTIRKTTAKQLEVMNHSIIGEKWKDKGIRWHQNAPYQVFFNLQYDESDELQKDIANKVIIDSRPKDLDFYEVLLDGVSNRYRKGKDVFTKLYDLEFYNGNELYDKTMIAELSTDGLHFYYHSGEILIDRREVNEITIKFKNKY